MKDGRFPHGSVPMAWRQALRRIIGPACRRGNRRLNHRVLGLAGELAVNVVGPWAVFTLLDSSLGDTKALIASALPPLIWSAIELARSRRLDALSAMVMAGILLTVVATLFGGSPRLLQIRENAVTGLIGVVFLATIWLDRPLIYHLARATYARQSPEAALRLQAFAATPKGAMFFRHITIVWGFGLILQTAILVWLAFIWPINRFLLLSPVIGYGLLGLLLLATLWYYRRLNLI
jgi:uncharacterized membrane protein